MAQTTLRDTLRGRIEGVADIHGVRESIYEHIFEWPDFVIVDNEKDGLLARDPLGTCYSLDSIKAYFQHCKPEFGNPQHINMLRAYEALSDI